MITVPPKWGKAAPLPYSVQKCIFCGALELCCAMNYTDKHGTLAHIRNREKTVIELGSCNNKAVEESIGIDAADLPETDIIADIEKGLPFLSARCLCR